jgi:hypothetical protein
MPAKLNIEKARPRERYEIREEILDEPKRFGPQRAVSEARASTARRDDWRSRDAKPLARRGASDMEEEDEYPGDLYDMYRNSRGSKSNSGRSRNQPQYIEEGMEDGSDYDDVSFDENDFEMVSSRPAPPRRSHSQARASSKRPEARKVRVKVHAEDTRYLMVGIAIEFPVFVDRIREKFGIRKRFKIKIRDDDAPNGDMITMGDQDDLEMAMMTVKANAKKERLDMGKMEVSTPHVASLEQELTRVLDLDPRIPLNFRLQNLYLIYVLSAFWISR